MRAWINGEEGVAGRNGRVHVLCCLEMVRVCAKPASPSCFERAPSCIPQDIDRCPTCARHLSDRLLSEDRIDGPGGRVLEHLEEGTGMPRRGETETVAKSGRRG